ncbi:MAG: hypothetical protein RLY45_1590, partial [Actinomycetota bacterium]
ALQSPDAARPTVLAAVSDSFMHGFGTACLSVSAIALLGCIAAAKFLPARATAEAG